MKKTIFILLLLIFLLNQNSFTQVVTIHRDGCFQGSRQTLSIGNFDQRNLSIGNDRLTAVNMSSNRHFLRLYEHSNFRGKYRDIYSDIVHLNSIEFNDKTSSIKVMASQTNLPTRNEQVISSQILNGTSLNIFVASNRPLRLSPNEVNGASRLHVQGLGIANARMHNERIVVTACEANSPTSGCTGSSFALLFNRRGELLDARELERFNGMIGGESHPSALQMIGNVFPVGTAEDFRGGDTRIRFFTIANDRIEIAPTSSDIEIEDFHIGAIAYSNINGNTFLVGATWDADRLLVFRANGENRTSGFEQIGNIAPSEFINSNSSIDDNWAPYNSIWLGKMAEDGRVILFATHGSRTLINSKSWADIWEINGLNSSHLNQTKGMLLSKIHKRWKNNTGFLERPFFYEGTVPIHNHESMPNIWALPDDFKLSGGELTSRMKELFYRASCGVQLNEDNQEEATSRTNNTIIQDYEEIDISVYPNPANEILNIDIQNLNINSIKTGTLQVLNAMGQLKQEIKIRDSKLRINTSDLDRGLYFIRLKTNTGFSTVKQFIKL